MMRANNILGLIFSNTFDSNLNELTSMRSMASVPYGGRYRLIDFPLSAMVNSGMGKVGIVTKSNYQSLMDHVGNGRAWDLSRKNGGLFILPPFNSVNTGLYSGRIEAIAGVRNFLQHSDEEYVLMADSNAVYNEDLTNMFAFHEDKGADITIAYVNGKAPKIDEIAEYTIDSDDRITSVMNDSSNENTNYSLNVILMRKSLLERLVNEAMNLKYHSFINDVLQRNIKQLKIYGYCFNGFVKMLDGMQSYFEANMELLNSENRKSLFHTQPVYTKVKDDVPAIYGLSSDVSNSLIADGCVIEGKVINSVLFRGVHVGKDAVIRDCVLMQNTYISDGVDISCVVADKNVVIKQNKVLSGDMKFPVYIGKGIAI